MRYMLLMCGEVEAPEPEVVPEARNASASTDGDEPCWMPWARPVAPSHEMRAAHILGLPLAGSNFPGIPVRKRLRTSSVSTPITES